MPRFRHDETNETDETNAKEATVAWHALILGLGLIGLGPRARKRRAEKGRKEGSGHRRPKGCCCIGSNRYRPAQRLWCIDVSNGIPRPADENGIDVYFDDWKSLAIGTGAPGYPDGPFRGACAPPLAFFDLARCLFRRRNRPVSRLKIEINGSPPSSSLLFPKRSKSITARSASQFCFRCLQVH